MNIQGKTKVLGLIGNPVEHTLSPVIHNTISRCIGANGEISPSVYVPFRVSEEGVCAAVKGAFELNIQGMNVTVPHKSAVIPFLSSIDPMAEAIGAVNTLVREEGGFKGYNTDAEGFKRELEFYGVGVEEKCVVMLGAGGASKAVVFALAQCNPSVIYIFNRTKEKAQLIADTVNGYFKKELVKVGTYDEIENIPEASYVAIQCTSVGLAPNVDDCVIEDGPFFDRVTAGVDIVYKPTETRFMKLLRQRNIPAYNGLRMLLYQGIAAYERFMEVQLDAETIEITARALEMAAGIKRPVILVGYMGSGKSSVSKRLSAMKGIEVIDTDEAIVERTGKSINDIFAQDGEQAFRDMETALIRELLSEEREQYILSVGGGLAVREENRRLLKTLGTVVYLRAKPEEIYERIADDTTRPLLRVEDPLGRIREMLKERGPAYEDAAGIIVDTDGKSISAIACTILDKLGMKRGKE